MLSAACTGDLDAAARLLDANQELIRAQFASYEPLHYAVRGGHEAMVRFLLARGGNPMAP